LRPKFANTATDHLSGERNGNARGMRSNFAAKGVRANQKKI